MHAKVLNPIPVSSRKPVSLRCDVAVFLARDGHNRRFGLFLDPGGRGVCLEGVSLPGKTNPLVAGHLHVEKTEVMDVLCIPSGEQNSPRLRLSGPHQTIYRTGILSRCSSCGNK